MKTSSARTINGRKPKLAGNDCVIMLDDAKVVTADVLAPSGVIHVIDTVLLPKD